MLIGAAAMPDLLPITDFIERKSYGAINHMTIQRKNISITGDSQQVMWFKIGNSKGWITKECHDQMQKYDQEYNKRFN